MSNDKPSIELTPAGPEDAHAVAHLWNEAFHEEIVYILKEGVGELLRKWLERDPSLYAGTTLARLDGEPAGYISLWTKRQPTSWHTAKTCLAVLCRRYGLPGGLLRVLRFWVSDTGNRFEPDALYIYMVGVDARHRGKGVGWRLLEHAEAEAPKHGKRALCLGVLAKNVGAIRLYERFGFTLGPRCYSRIHDVACGDGHHHFMRKELETGA